MCMSGMEAARRHHAARLYNGTADRGARITAGRAFLAQWQTGQGLFQPVDDDCEHEQNAAEQGNQLHAL